jgi:spermidine synthase
VVASGGPRPPADYGFADANAVLGSFIAGPPTLRQFAAGAALNTDDRPVVAYRAPRVTYAPDSTPADRLMALLAALRIAPGEVVDAVADPAGAARLAAYWAARDGFLQAGRGIRPSGDVRAMLAQVREPLLGVLRTSPDFRPAYDPLLRLAVALHRSDAAAARELLAALVRAAPLRPEAGLAITQLEAQAQHVKP